MFFSPSEPPCLSELERIQVLDGGKRRFGRCPHQSLSLLMVASLRLFKRFLLPADEKQDEQIRGLEPDTTANGRSSRQGPCVHVGGACASFFFPLCLAEGLFSQVSPRTGGSRVPDLPFYYWDADSCLGPRNLVRVSF